MFPVSSSVACSAIELIAACCVADRHTCTRYDLTGVSNIAASLLSQTASASDDLRMLRRDLRHSSGLAVSCQRSGGPARDPERSRFAGPEVRRPAALPGNTNIFEYAEIARARPPGARAPGQAASARCLKTLYLNVRVCAARPCAPPGEMHARQQCVHSAGRATQPATAPTNHARGG